jgi:hypothetical protein
MYGPSQAAESGAQCEAAESGAGVCRAGQGSGSPAACS